MIPAHITAEELHSIGAPAVVPSESPSEDFGVVFEDDGQTGYFYALDLSSGGQAIVDATHIYNVQQVQDRDRPSSVKIGWSTNGWSAVLLINDYPHAVFDFQGQRGYCRSGFPQSSIGSLWPRSAHTWSDQALNLFSEP